MILLDHVQKSFGKHVAIRDLQLDVPDGASFGLLGPNGAGKSTLLRMIMGVLAPDSGRIVLFGDQAPGTDAVTRRIGYMPQELALYDGLTVLENVLFFGRMYGLGGSSLRERAQAVVERVELGARMHSLAGTLSGGMMRRAMLATAMVHRPRLLILDEPTAGVDPLLRLRFWDWFGELAAEGTTLLITTHHISEAARCSDVLFLREGAVLERGRPQDLISRYAASDLEEAFVASTQAHMPEADQPEDRP